MMYDVNAGIFLCTVPNHCYGLVFNLIKWCKCRHTILINFIEPCVNNWSHRFLVISNLVMVKQTIS